MKVRYRMVGIDLYEIDVKRNLFSSWETLYDGSFPLRISKKTIIKNKNRRIEKWKIKNF